VKSRLARARELLRAELRETATSASSADSASPADAALAARLEGGRP
jgi:hypothetical protein